MVQRSNMMHNRRSELEHSRRDPRERDSSPAGMSRKRPSMLSEFQGKHVYGDRDRSRMYSADNTYTSRSHDYYHGGSHRNKAHMTSNQGGGGGKYGGPSGGYHRPNYNDPRHRSYHHFPQSRSNNEVMFGSNFVDNDVQQQHFAKRPKLIDTNRPDKMMMDSGKGFSGSSITNSNIIPLMDAPGIANATNAPATNSEQFTEDTFPQYGSLQQYLSDIESEDDVDVVAQLDREQPEQQQQQQQSQAGTEKEIKKLMDDDVVVEKKEEPQPPAVVCKMTKEELLLLMERVDHDIAKVELQVNVLKKKEAELADAEVRVSQPQPPPLPSPTTSSHDLVKEVTLPSLDTSHDLISTPRLPSPVQPSMVETILAENKRRAESIAGTLLSTLSHAAWMTRRLQPLYWQPCEAPGYHERIERHKRLRPQLVQVIRRRKLELHRRDTKLCEHYETLLNEWEKKVEKTENNTKRKAKDVRNKEFFEKHFPEIKRHTLRLGPKGFSVVRSEAELNEILDELYEQEEALERYQKAHAPIPPMIFNSKDDHKFISNNGLVRDPLMVYKEKRVTSTWTDEEKQTFCEKYALYPKSFDKISQFIPNKTTADCVQFYYLSKKKENYKEHATKAKEQKRKAALLARQQLAADAASSYGNSSPCASQMRKLSEEGKSKGKLRLLNETRVPTYTGWTPDEIQRLREGLRLYGRAWGKIYRMVGPVKTATQCKSFFDDYRDDPHLQLHKALSEHNIIKNAQKAKRKAEARKQSASSLYELEKKRRKQKEVIIQESSDDATDDIESDRDSIINSSVVSEEKTFSEITTEGETLSSHTDSESSTEEADEVIDHTASQRTRPNRLPSVRTSEDNIDMLFSAAEALASVDSSNGIFGVSTKVALHDHTYSKPTGSLMNSSEFQGSSGLSLIAAAAAVVSPTLSSSPTGKSPLPSPVKAPRGRPPSSQKRSNTVGAKLGPTFLSPAGPSMHISLTETKSYRGRGRGTTIPLTKTIPHASKNSGITTKLTIPANRVGKASVMSPTTGPSKFPPFSTGSNKSSSLSHTVTQSSTLAAFEALVNVAAAAKPAELPPPRSSNVNHPSHTVNAQQSKKDGPSDKLVVDLVSVLTNSTPTVGTTSSLTPTVHLPIQSTLRLPVHSVSSKQTTVVMSTASKPVRSLPQKLFPPHSSLDSSKSLFTSEHKSTVGKIDSPVRTLTVYAPLLAAQQAQGQSVGTIVSSSSLVIRKSTPTSGQHPIFTTTNKTVTETTSSSYGKSLAVAKPPSTKASLLVKGIPPRIEVPAKPAESTPVDEKKDQLVERLSDGGSSHSVDSPKPVIVTESNTTPDDKMEPVNLQLESNEDNELLSAPLRITLGQGSSSSSKLVPISISRPPEDEVLVLTAAKSADSEAPPKLPANAPVTKAAKKAQKVTKLEKPKSKKPRTSDDYDSRKDQPESTTINSQASTDFLSVLMPALVTDSSSSGNFTTPMFLNSLTSTTGPLPTRSNITHIMDRSHSNSPATDLMNTTTADNEDHLVSATHDISELSKLLEPLSSDNHQSNLDGHHDKAQAVPSNATDFFCPNAIALSLFSTVPDSEQEANSTPATSK